MAINCIKDYPALKICFQCRLYLTPGARGCVISSSFWSNAGGLFSVPETGHLRLYVGPSRGLRWSGDLPLFWGKFCAAICVLLHGSAGVCQSSLRFP